MWDEKGYYKATETGAAVIYVQLPNILIRFGILVAVKYFSPTALDLMILAGDP
jgi:hypothetical protein